MVSHNKHFVGELCSEAWLVKGGTVHCNVRRDGDEDVFTMDVKDNMTQGYAAKRVKESKEQKKVRVIVRNSQNKIEHDGGIRRQAGQGVHTQRTQRTQRAVYNHDEYVRCAVCRSGQQESSGGAGGLLSTH
eukprot:1190072-Prorocentrum_minimum.AAC.1